MNVVILFLASHIDTTVLSDGTYELIPESEGGDHEAQVNAAILTEDPESEGGDHSLIEIGIYLCLCCATPRVQGGSWCPVVGESDPIHRTE